MKKKRTIGVHLRLDYIEAIRLLSLKDERTFSSYISLLLRKHIDKELPNFINDEKKENE